jgi:hypothetical protein
MDLKTLGNSNSNVNSDVIKRLQSSSDPTQRTNSGEIAYNINGLDKHIMTAVGLGINMSLLIYQIIQHLYYNRK